MNRMKKVELAGGQWRYIDKKRPRACLEGFRILYENKDLCDVTILVEGEEFPCHRALLASSSEYFHAMFTSNFVEKASDQIVLNEISAKTMSTILNYLYKGEVIIDSGIVQSLFNSAHMLQLVTLEDTCVEFMKKHITENNCVGVYFFASMYGREELVQASKEKICRRFSRVTKGNEFLKLSAQQTFEILCLDGVDCASEVDVYSAALNWLEHNQDSTAVQQENIYEVMKAVRFGLMDEHYFRQKVKNRSMFKNCRPLQNLFDQVIYFTNHPNRWRELDLVLEPRVGDHSSYSCPKPLIMSINSSSNSCSYQLRGFDRHSGEVYPWDNYPGYLHNAQAVTAEGSTELYLAGGTMGHCRTVYKMQYPHGQQKATSMSHGRSQFPFVQVDRFLYAVGGFYKGMNTDHVEKYNIQRNQWTRVASLPTRVSCSCAVAYRGKLYVFGGEVQLKKDSRREISNETFCYDPETDKWMSRQPMLTPRALAGCAVFQNRIYITGGFKKISESWLTSQKPDHCLHTTEIYDPATDNWSLGPPLPKPLCAMGVFKFYGTIFVVGGVTTGFKFSYDIYYLDGAGTTWRRDKMSIEDLPVRGSPTIHTQYLPIHCPLAHRMYSSDTESESTCGITSLDDLDIDNHRTSSSSEDYRSDGSWLTGTESSSSDGGF